VPQVDSREHGRISPRSSPTPILLRPSPPAPPGMLPGWRRDCWGEGPAAAAATTAAPPDEGGAAEATAAQRERFLLPLGGQANQAYLLRLGLGEDGEEVPPMKSLTGNVEETGEGERGSRVSSCAASAASVARRVSDSTSLSLVRPVADDASPSSDDDTVAEPTAAARAALRLERSVLVRRLGEAREELALVDDEGAGLVRLGRSILDRCGGDRLVNGEGEKEGSCGAGVAALHAELAAADEAKASSGLGAGAGAEPDYVEPGIPAEDQRIPASWWCGQPAVFDEGDDV